MFGIGIGEILILVGIAGAIFLFGKKLFLKGAKDVVGLKRELNDIMKAEKNKEQ